VPKRQPSVADELAIFCKGAAEVIEERALEERIVEARKQGRPLRIKLGADPSAPDIHLGHSVVLWKLHELQELGHEIIFLIGDYTGRIGDPTGKSETRKPLTEDAVARNAQTYKDQIFKILCPNRTRVVFNSEWLAPMLFADVIKLAANYTVARMLERDDFENRYREGRAIGVHEFFYPLMQGYDSVALEADVELGGTDQKFNILVGRDLQRAYGQKPQACLLMPLLEGTDGVQKMSKSLGNYIGVNEPPIEMFGKVMSISDELMFKYHLLLTEFSAKDVDELRARVESGELHPMEAKKRLAVTLVETYHGGGAAVEARAEFERIFSHKEEPSDMPQFVLGLLESETPAARLFSLVFEVSGGEAKRLIKGGGARVDGVRVEGPQEPVNVRSGMVLQAGKRRFCRLVE